MALRHIHSACDRPLTPRAFLQGTWYNTGLGACGITNNDSQFIIAISADIYGDAGNCGQVRFLWRFRDSRELSAPRS